MKPLVHLQIYKFNIISSSSLQYANIKKKKKVHLFVEHPKKRYSPSTLWKRDPQESV